MYQYSYCTPLKTIRNYCINKVIEHLGIDPSETYRANREERSGAGIPISSVTKRSGFRLNRLFLISRRISKSELAQFGGLHRANGFGGATIQVAPKPFRLDLVGLISRRISTDGSFKGCGGGATPLRREPQGQGREAAQPLAAKSPERERGATLWSLLQNYSCATFGKVAKRGAQLALSRIGGDEGWTDGYSTTTRRS